MAKSTSPKSGSVFFETAEGLQLFHFIIAFHIKSVESSYADADFKYYLKIEVFLKKN